MPLTRIKRRGRQVCVQCEQMDEVAYWLGGYPHQPLCPGCVTANYQAAREANRLRRAAVSDSEMAYWQEVEVCEHGVDIAHHTCHACKEE